MCIRDSGDPLYYQLDHQKKNQERSLSLRKRRRRRREEMYQPPGGGYPPGGSYPPGGGYPPGGSYQPGYSSGGGTYYQGQTTYASGPGGMGAPPMGGAYGWTVPMGVDKDYLKRQAETIFMQHDSNRTGRLEGVEFYRALCALFQVLGHAPPSQDYAFQIWARFDKSRDGRIDLHEFKKVAKELCGLRRVKYQERKTNKNLNQYINTEKMAIIYQHHLYTNNTRNS
eukprot:TRINITY_DN4795_c0_g1_i2.p1 TRINITY_DN4795_c0_g1~~TRINITY_DN4795_c0_g1_i2.p1  ORF type:complete len:226 (-),score=48.28 TRINITY_DN4795_c0_g1_i2:60-737(-)